MTLSITQASAEDFDTLVELRIDSMRESLEAIGRFNRERSIERFRSSFAPENTRKVEKDGVLVGFIAVSKFSDHLNLDHLCIHPVFQSSGIGSMLMKVLIEESEKEGIPIRLGALRSSRSNDFYQRQGFVILKEDEFDIYYERKNRVI